MNAGLAVFGAIALGVAVWLFKYRKAPKTTTALALAAGIGFGGAVGSVLGQIVAWVIGLAGSATGTLLGIGSAAAVTVLAVFATLEVILRGIVPKTARPQRWHAVLALLLPTLVIAGGVPVLGGIMSAASSGLDNVGAALSSLGGMSAFAPAAGVRAIACTSTGGQSAGSGGGLSESQRAHAAAIVAAGQEMGAPQRAQVIAVATAMQESNLRMYANDTVPASFTQPHEAVGSDHDSVGLFQQRDSWGTVAERMDPAASARLFYERLLALPGWESMPLTQAAQRVQISAFPTAYAKWEDDATRVVGGISCAPEMNA